MSDLNLKIDSLKNLYAEICLGFSEFEYSGKPIFIKHFTEIESGFLTKRKEIFEKEAIHKGLEYKQDKLIFLMKEGVWDRENENKIDALKKEISDLNLILQNLIIKKQIKETKNKIKNLENQVEELEKEKNSLIGFCVEDYVEKNYNEYFIFEAFYENQELTKKYFTNQEYNNLEETDLIVLVQLLNLFYKKFALAQIKRISACSFFMNLFNLCDDNAFHFYGKFVKDLTVFQANLFSQSKYFKSLMQNKAQSQPPEDIADDPDKMIEWFEMVASEKITSADDNALGVGYAGASKEELQKMAGGKAVTISEIAREKGNKLTTEDFLKMHGI